MATYYKLGKAPATLEAYKLHFTDYSTLPKVPRKFGHYKIISDWGMLGNDRFGDCVWAGAAHETMLWNKEASRTILFSPKDVLSDYTAVTGFDPNDPNTDNGTNVSTAAEYRKNTGIIDDVGVRHKVGSYVDLTPGDLTELKHAVYMFGAAGIGIQVPASAQEQFQNGKPWDVSDAPIEGGHYIPIVGWDRKYFYLVTWGKVWKATYAFIKRYMDEGVVYLSEEFLTNGVSPEHFNLQQLIADEGQL